GEMKPRGRRGDGAGMRGVNRMIALAIQRCGGACPPDIGRQGSLPQKVRLRREVAGMMELQSEPSSAHVTDNFGLKLFAEMQPTADPGLFGCLDEGHPKSPPSGKTLEQQ